MNFRESLSNGVRAPSRDAAFSIRPVVAAFLTGIAVVFSLWPASARSGELSLERLFSAPDLSGPTLRGVKISPDGKLVAYLRARDDDKDRFDLWAFDVTEAKHR